MAGGEYFHKHAFGISTSALRCDKDGVCLFEIGRILLLTPIFLLYMDLPIVSRVFERVEIDFSCV